MKIALTVVIVVCHSGGTMNAIIESRYYDSCLRTNVIYARSLMSGPTVESMLAFAAGDSHSSFERYPSMDCTSWFCYISDLNHTFMVQLEPEPISGNTAG